MKITLKFTALFLVFISFIVFARVFFLNSYPDFSVYYYGSKVAFLGINPYLRNTLFFASYSYPPFVLLFFLPLIFFSSLLAEKIWTFLSFIFLIASIFLIFKVNKQELFSTLSFFIYFLILVFFPIKFTLGMGQINLLILFLLVLFIYSYQQNKTYLSGFFLGLSLILKLFPIILIPYLLIRKKWKILFASLLTIFCFSLFSYFLINQNINFYFIQKVLPNLINGWKGDYYNQSLSGFLMRQINDNLLREFLKISISIILLVLTGIATLRKRNNNTFNLELSLIIALNLIINPFSWQHHFVWLLIPLLFTFFYIKNKRLNYKYYLILGLSYFLVAANLKHPLLFPIPLQSHVFYGALLLFFLNLYLLLNRSKKEYKTK